MATATPGAPSRLPRAPWPLALAGVVALAIVPWLGALACGFVYDDLLAVVGNPVVSGPLDLGTLLGTGFWGQGRGATIGSYRPLAVLTFAFDHRLGAGAPWAFHLTNLVLHALASVALAVVLARRTGRRDVAWVAAALFAVHALHAENVAGIVGRADVLATLLVLIAWDLAGRPRLRVALLAAPVLLLALLAKEIAVALVAVVAVEIALGLAPPGTATRRVRVRVAVLGALAAAVAAYLALRWSALGTLGAPVDWRSNPLAEATPGVRVLTAGALTTRAVGLLLAPVTLSPDYSWAQIMPAATAWRADVIAGLALWVAAPLALVGLRRRAPAVALGILWLLAAWGPVSNLLFPVPTIFGERLLYLPSAGACLAIAAACVPLARGAPWRRTAVALLAVLLLAHGARGAVRTLDWRSQRTLFEAAAAAAPRSARVWHNLGIVELEGGRLDRAARYLELASEIAPRWAEPRSFLGIARVRQGDRAGALEAFARALDADAACAPCATNLARFHLRYGRPADALEVAERHRAAGGDAAVVERLRAEALRTP